ncbi:helix-turn-helix domain-containing protein [Rhodococcus sp. MSC1_016]|jgi:ABC-type proline/glycine betaine transport system permease subunit|uniref:helix-turn-helix domain-containing protein n=1 Tax=Rhodococcus sp. MSC1_016 TaxID=2909266 RepID=UPI002030DF5D|nr:helix-turn-helix transcriptional regulator [Rhodococcus sp. MSC1_016]
MTESALSTPPRVRLSRNSDRRALVLASSLEPVPAILNAMRSVGVGIHELADAVGETVAALLRWFERPGSMPLEAVVAIAEFLGIRPSALF